MPVKIRLQRHGRKKRPFYHIVIADVRAPRDGRFIEKLGVYDPMTKPATIELDKDKALDWLNKGAQPTDTARAILRFTGVLYKKHLQRGVSKGAMTQEEADSMFAEFIAEKESKVQKRRDQTTKERLANEKKISGNAPVVEVAEIEEEAPEEDTTEAAPVAVEANDPKAEAPVVVEEEVSTESVQEEVAAEAPKPEVKVVEEVKESVEKVQEEAAAEKASAEEE